MTNLMDVYVCELCGNIVEVLGEGDGELVCCGQAMTLQKEGMSDAAKEKHVPVIEFPNNRVVVKVGQIPHPMEPNHSIEWIEFQEGNQVKRHHLKPGDKPIAEFCTNGGSFTVRAYCNLHGLWKNSCSCGPKCNC